MVDGGLPSDGLSQSMPVVGAEELSYMGNKLTACYWLQSSQRSNNTGERSLTPRIVLATIYEAWVHSHLGKPDIEFRHFIANPVRFTASGPTTIRGIIAAHRTLCSRASDYIVANGGANYVLGKRRLHPLYHCIVMILDRHEYSSLPSNGADANGFTSLRKIAKIQTCLLALTGMSSSTPISLEGLRAHALPLEKSDEDIHDLEVLRVPVMKAVQFLVALEWRENLRLPQDFELDVGICPGASKSPGSWAAALMREAEQKGIDNVIHTRSSVRRVLAEQVGEKYYELEHDGFHPGAKWRW